jgi:glycosyltransferase involved in cell wall biosynthesis
VTSPTAHATPLEREARLVDRSADGASMITGLAEPTISIVVPVLNEERLLARTLMSFPRALRERHGVELIVSDGGSSDRTVEIAREHADIVVEHREARRQTIAEGRNRGGERARGELLVFINGDTIPRDPERFLSSLVEVSTGISSGSGIAAIACPVEIEPTERRTSDVLFHRFFNTYVRLLNRIGLGMGRGECQVMPRALFERVGGYNDAMAAGEDFDLYKRLAEHGRIGHHEGLFVYESPRRFRRYGYLRVLWQWTLNGVSVAVAGRSYSKEWEQVR